MLVPSWFNTFSPCSQQAQTCPKSVKQGHDRRSSNVIFPDFKQVSLLVRFISLSYTKTCNDYMERSDHAQLGQVLGTSIYNVFYRSDN